MPKATKTTRKKKSARPVRFEAALLQRMRTVTDGCSFAEVGAATGIHPETVRRYLQGLATPSVQFVAALSRSEGVSADWLLHGDQSLDPAGAIDRMPLAMLLERVAKRLGTQSNGKRR